MLTYLLGCDSEIYFLFNLSPRDLQLYLVNISLCMLVYCVHVEKCNYYVPEKFHALIFLLAWITHILLCVQL